MPIIGALHLELNRTLLLSHIKDQSESIASFAYWLAPQNRYRVALAFYKWLRALDNAQHLKKSNATAEGASDLVNKTLMKVLMQNPSIDGRELANIYEGTFPSLFVTKSSIMGGRVELLVYPGRVMCALYHYRAENSPMAIPIGVLSTTP